MIDYKFQDGDYFVWNKLSDWQKEYLLWNLYYSDSASETLNVLKENSYANVILFKKERYYDLSSSFSPESIDNKDCKREVYFKDVYQNPIPSWVTFNTSKDMLGCLDLVDGKDYKVIELVVGDRYLILDDEGQMAVYHNSFFCEADPSISEKYTHSEEDDRGFEGLGYVPPKVDTEYAVIDCKNLSSEQIEFITETLNPHDFDDIDVKISDCRYLNYDVDGQEWFLYDKSHIDTEIHFNDIFVYKD